MPVPTRTIVAPSSIGYLIVPCHSHAKMRHNHIINVFLFDVNI